MRRRTASFCVFGGDWKFLIQQRMADALLFVTSSVCKGVLRRKDGFLK